MLRTDPGPPSEAAAAVHEHLGRVRIAPVWLAMRSRAVASAALGDLLPAARARARCPTELRTTSTQGCVRSARPSPRASRGSFAGERWAPGELMPASHPPCYPVAVPPDAPALAPAQVPRKLEPGESFRQAIERMHPGHEVTLLFDGAAAFPAMLDAIVQARTSIDLETYIWAPDENGRRFRDAICIKAQEGVKVRAVIDGAGSWTFSGEDVRRLAAAGVQLSIFHPVGPWRRRWGWQIRDHRKLLVIDGSVAFTGGMNLGDDYAPREWGGRNWRDVHARIEGPVVGELRRLFEMTWRYAEPETWKAPKKLPFYRHHFGQIEQAAIGARPTRVQALAIGRWLGRRVIQRHLQQAIGAAKRRVWIESAYFIPTRPLRRALRNAALRGADVRVMVPRNLDVPGLSAASRYTWAQLLKDGVHIVEWLPTMLHAKTIAIDSEWCSLGSYNLDQRSLRYNWELAVSIWDPQVAQELERRFEEGLRECAEVRPEEWKRRPLRSRVQERFFYFFRLWL